jgi:hypothetical protein
MELPLDVNTSLSAEWHNWESSGPESSVPEYICNTLFKTLLATFTLTKMQFSPIPLPVQKQELC